MSDTPVPRPILAVSTAIFREGRVLLARRGAATMNGLWSLPGGRVEAGETLEAAARREAMEEVGVDCAILGLSGALDIIRHDEAGTVTTHFVVVSYAGRWVAGEPSTGPEASEVGWFAPDALPGAHETTPDLAGIIASAHRVVEAGT